MRQSRCSRSYQVDSGKGYRTATPPFSTTSREKRVRGAARGKSALELVMRPRSVVGRREERPTVPGWLRANIAEVRLGKEALAEARDEFR
eukprot:scaffold85423_cov39-Phaeocystis_antarctica.AAC.1